MGPALMIAAVVLHAAATWPAGLGIFCYGNGRVVEETHHAFASCERSFGDVGGQRRGRLLLQPVSSILLFGGVRVSGMLCTGYARRRRARARRGTSVFARCRGTWPARLLRPIDFPCQAPGRLHAMSKRHRGLVHCTSLL